MGIHDRIFKTFLFYIWLQEPNMPRSLPEERNIFEKVWNKLCNYHKTRLCCQNCGSPSKNDFLTENHHICISCQKRLKYLESSFLLFTEPFKSFIRKGGLYWRTLTVFAIYAWKLMELKDINHITDKNVRIWSIASVYTFVLGTV